MAETTNVRFTILNKEDGILTKRIYINDDGKVDKDPTQCFLDKGKAYVNQCDFNEFPAVLRSLQKNECIVHGIFDDDEFGEENGVVGIVKKATKQNEYHNQRSIISRSLEYFSYPKINAITMFDYDVEGDEKVYTVDEYIRTMSSIFPEFAKCAKVVTASTSSCIYDVEGTLLTGEKPSFHMYFQVKDSTDIVRFKETLFKRCWLAGHGIIRTDKNKIPLLRTIFDASVFSPERLDFVAGAFCEDGLVQKLPDPEYHDGNVLDTSLLEVLTSEEEVEYKKLLYQAKQPYVRGYEVYKEERIVKLQQDKDWSEQKSRNYVDDLDSCILWNEFWLTFDTGEEITVKDLLSNGEKYDGKTLYDPHKPEKGRNKAKFFWNDGKNSLIHSFTHGGRNYTFKRDNYKGRTKPVRTDKEPTFDGLSDFISKEESRQELKKCLKDYFGKSYLNQLIIMNAGIGKTRSFMDAMSEALKRTKKLFSVRVAYFLPDNDLSQELLQEYHRKKHLIGMPCMIRGRGHYNDHLKPPCTWAEQFLKSKKSEEDYQRKVSNINADFCSSCSFRGTCEYFQQFKNAQSAHLIFFPHQYLFTMTSELKELVSTISHVVVDEDIVSSLVLNNAPGVGVFSFDRQDSDVIRSIIDDIEHGAEMKHVILKHKDLILDEYKKYRTVKKPKLDTSIKEFNKTDNINELAKFRKADNQRSFWKLLKKTCEKIDDPLFHSNSISVNNVWVDGNEVKVCEKQEINSLWNEKKMLYLDASADPEVVERAIGKKFKVNQIRTHYHENVSIKQVYDNLYTSSHLKNNYEKTFASLISYFDGNLPPFITNKATEDIVKATGIVGSACKSGHFKKVRGTDKFKDDEELLVIGRYLINGDALKDKARMLYPLSKEPLDFAYPSQEFVYRMKDGRNMATMQKDYLIGSDVWKLNNHLSRSETEQAIARKRLFDVKDVKKKIVYLLTSQVLDITTSELIPSSMFMFSVPRDTGNKIQDNLLALMKSNGGIIRWKPKQLSELTGISTDNLNGAKTRSWFVNNPYWKVINCTYDKIGKRSRKTPVNDKLLVLNGVEVDEQVIIDLNPYDRIDHIEIAGRC